MKVPCDCELHKEDEYETSETLKLHIMTGKKVKRLLTGVMSRKSFKHVVGSVLKLNEFKKLKNEIISNNQHVDKETKRTFYWSYGH